MSAPVGLIVPAFTLKFEGHDADEHMLEASAAGAAISGAARLYTGIAHFVILGTTPRGNYKREFACYSRPAAPGSWDQVFLVLSATGAYSLHAAIYNEAISFAFTKAVSVVVNIWKRPGDTVEIVERFTETIERLSGDHRAVMEQMTKGLMSANEHSTDITRRLIDKFPAVADATRQAGRELVTPVGTSCRSMTQFADTAHAETVSEADAEVIRGDEEMEVDDMAQFTATRISEINISTGHCILQVEGFPAPVAGRITDPALKSPENVYTSALHHHTGLTIDAKPVRQREQVKRLYISHAVPNPG